MARPKSKVPKDEYLNVRIDAALSKGLAAVTKLEPDISKAAHARIAIRQYCIAKLKEKEKEKEK